jgi:endonuclease YncB( thermonuclease family)
LNFSEQAPTVKFEEVQVAEVLDGDSIEVFRSNKSHEKIRYLAIGAPELKQSCGEEARKYHAELVNGKKGWIQWQESKGKPVKDRNGRLLAYVYLDKELKRLVELELVRNGYSGIDIRGADNFTPDDDFRLKWLKELVEAQTDAAKARRGCWKKEEWCAPADLAIVFIKFWSRDEIVYLLNRSEKSVSLENFMLRDASVGKRGTINFQGLVEPHLRLLPPGGLFRIHSGPANTDRKLPSGPANTDRKLPCSRNEQDPALDCYWTGAYVWNNDKDQAFLKSGDGKVICKYEYKGREG